MRQRTMVSMNSMLPTEKVRFRFLQPGIRFSDDLTQWLCYHPRLRYALERLNTRLPRDVRRNRSELLELCRMRRRLATIAMAYVINELVEHMPRDQAYVNVGVWYGFSLFAGMVGNPDSRCVGIDNFSQFGDPRADFYEKFQKLKSPNHSFEEMDYREYFRTRNDLPIGLYYYDGDHSYEHQLEGLKIAEPHFADGCIVIVDDTNWDAPRDATRDFLASSSASYDVLDLPTACNRHPTWWNGLMVLRKTS